MAASVWLLRLDRPMTAAEQAAAWALLPAERRQRLERIPPEGRQPVLGAYWLLGAMLREAYGWQRLPEMARAPGGKPWFPAAPRVHFSLSHTPGAAAAALAAGPVGVDIQRLRPLGAFPRLRRQLGCGQGTPEDFFREWVQLEARAKQAGRSARGMLGAPAEEGACLHVLEAFPGYAAALAAGAEGPPVLRRFTLDAFPGDCPGAGLTFQPESV